MPSQINDRIYLAVIRSGVNYLKVSDQGSKRYPLSKPITRNRGCWNCTAWDNQERARNYWNERRQKDLNQALTLTQIHAEGEEHSTVVSIRRMVDQVDRAMAQNIFGVCLKGKAEADLVHHAYLCDGWMGREGASLATSGTAPDLLPEELKARRDEDKD